MITDERKGELIADLEMYVNRFLNKQCLISDSIDDISENEEESDFLYSCSTYFAVMLPEDK